MKYYNPLTRKRPDFESIWERATIKGNPCYPYIHCECMALALVTRETIFYHWQQGHFDVYDEVKEKNKGFDYDSLKREN